MSKKVFFLISSLLFFSHFSFAQNQVSTNEFRLNQLKTLMDYRFVGGYYGFESMFLKSVKYTDEARQNCIVGIVIASFDVNCKGVITNIKLRNPLGYKMDDQISAFLKSTKGHWNPCQDQKYTHFEVPFMFNLKNTRTNTADAAFVYVGDNPGYACLSDAYYMKKIKAALKKKKGNKAKDFLEILIHRDPYNTEYYQLLDQSIKLTGKDKDKKNDNKKEK
ncbi:MAG: energy transducer TonB [Bacteroidales bacterium]|nr:energy transducer TonB [Bacteroidales bacterium]